LRNRTFSENGEDGWLGHQLLVQHAGNIYPGILKVKLPAILLKCLSRSVDPDPEKQIQFKDLLVLLRSQDGISIGELELRSSPTFI
jgi:hypothetical protein